MIFLVPEAVVANGLLPLDILEREVDHVLRDAESDIAAPKSWHHLAMPTGSTNINERASDGHRWWTESEARWREALRIAAGHPGIDASDVYHSLRCLDLPPAERLRRGLTRVRRRSHAG